MLLKSSVESTQAGTRTILFGRLTRPMLGLAVAATAVVGWRINPGTTDWKEGALLFAAVLLLAMSSSAWNQLQEIEVDRRMQRTCKRPLVTGEISAQGATLMIVVLMLLGLSVLYFLSPLSLVPATLTIVSYNLIYTPMKKRTNLALLPGAICGALPPVIGWYVVGGDSSPLLAYHKALLTHFVALIFLWQIPHFILQELRCGDDYRQASLPTLGRLFSERNLWLVMGVWLIALIAATLMLARLLAPLAVAQISFIGAALGLLCWMCFELLREGRELKVGRLFHLLHAVMFFWIVLFFL